MKMSMFLFLVSVMFNPFFSKISAFEETPSQNKTYLTKEQISLENHEIWVQINGNWIQARNLSANSNGIFIKDEDFLGYWECSRCGYINPPWNFLACGRCGNAK